MPSLHVSSEKTYFTLFFFLNSYFRNLFTELENHKKNYVHVIPFYREIKKWKKKNIVCFESQSFEPWSRLEL